MAELHVGTSGWNSDHWRGIFYPRDLRPGGYLRHYASRFASVEISDSFSHMPSEAEFEAWAEATPPEFVFTATLPKSISHGRRLKGSAGPLASFLRRVRHLGSKLGPVLLQLPPTLRCDIGLLEQFLNSTPEAREHQIALQARHESWFDPLAMYDLRRLGVAVVIEHSDRYPEAPHVPTAPFVYLRFHGPGQMFASRYRSADLGPWAQRIHRWLQKDLDVYAYFANDFEGHAVANARMLWRMVEEKPVSRSAVAAPR
jgi:uncharacterized protein YecE (DUF72 family)